jgi:N-acetylglucosamine-6-phosphate deacetylase
MAIAALGPERGIAITDGTAAVGLPAGTRTRLGSQTITAGPDVARLDDGTFAGSVLTMDAAFRNAVTVLGLDVMSASRLCAGNPARALGLADAGAITAGARADLAVLDADFRVLETYVAGVRVYEAAPRP